MGQNQIAQGPGRNGSVPQIVSIAARPNQVGGSGAGGFFGCPSRSSRWQSRPFTLSGGAKRRLDPPHLAMSGVDRVVAALIDQTVAEVRVSPRSGATWGKLGMVLQNYDFKAEARYAFSQAEQFDPRQPRWPYFQGAMLAALDSQQAIE